MGPALDAPLLPSRQTPRPDPPPRKSWFGLTCPETREPVASCDCRGIHRCPICKKILSANGLCCDVYDTRAYVAIVEHPAWDGAELNYRRAEFVYEAARLAALAAKAPVVSARFFERDKAFEDQFLKFIYRQCGANRSESPEELHGTWMEAYYAMGWTHGEVYDPENRVHPDLVPYAELGQLEQDKDSVFVALCEIARLWIRE